MRSLAGAIVSAAFLTVTIAFATDAPPPPQPPEQPQDATAVPEQPKEDRVICKKIKTTGSRLPTEKICKKQSEWDAESEANANAAKRDLEQATSKQ